MGAPVRRPWFSATSDGDFQPGSQFVWARAGTEGRSRGLYTVNPLSAAAKLSNPNDKKAEERSVEGRFFCLTIAERGRMINTVPGFMERSAAQEIRRGPVPKGPKLDETGCCGPFAKERIKRFDLRGAGPGGSGDSGKCEGAVWSAGRLCRDVDPARSRVRIRPGGVVRQPETSGTYGVRTKVWAGMGSAEIAKAEFPTND